MKINESNFDITVCQYDWGVPIIFNLVPDTGLSIIGETAVLTFGGVIDDRVESIDSDNFDFPFSLTEEEADSLFTSGVVNPHKIPYSLKRYKNGQYLDTLFDANLIITRTVKWDGESYNQESSQNTG